MIDSCLHCTRKHLRQSMITWIEARKGHPEKWDVSLGHLAEAADAVLLLDESVAFFLREEYLKYDANRDYIINWQVLFDLLDRVANQINSASVDTSNSA